MVLLESSNLPLGSDVSDFLLPGVDGEKYSLSDFSDAKALVVVFMCNHCPYVQAVWKRLVDLQAKFQKDGVKFVGINPNFNPKYEEETMPHMVEYSKKYAMNFPYLLDESQDVARAYKAQCTPDIYVYDEGRKLAYHGRIDDSWKDESKVTRRELEDAIFRLIKGEKPDMMQSPSMGCSIKWRE